MHSNNDLMDPNWRPEPREMPIFLKKLNAVLDACEELNNILPPELEPGFSYSVTRSAQSWLSFRNALENLNK